MLEAANRSSVMAANISSGNIGEDARNDIAWRRDWVARLTEAEQFFDNLFKTNSLPYTLFYSTKIIPGSIDYKTETQTLSINTNLHAPGAWIWLSSVEKSLQAVYDGLDATKRKRDWKLENWPWGRVTDLRPFDKKRKIFSIAVELVNSHGTVIGRANFQSEGSWGFNGNGRPQIYISDDDRKQVRFASVKADDITDNLTIRITSVNDIEANAAARTGVLQVKAISEAEWDSYVLFRMGRNGIIGYNGKGREVVIPDSIWNEPVTSIGDGAFKYRGITSITIGKNVEIHENAFDNKFFGFYNKNYTSKYGWQERRAGIYYYYGSGWTLTLLGAEAEMARLEQQRLEQERWERERAERERQERERLEQQRQEAEKIEAERKAFVEAERNSWLGFPFIVIPILPGALIMMNSIDSTYSGGGVFFSLGGEFFYGSADFIRWGLNMDFGLIFIDGDVVKRIHDIDTYIDLSSAGFFKIGVLASLYPVSSGHLSWYLSGGAGFGYYGTYSLIKTEGDDKISGTGIWAPVLSVGTGLVYRIFFLEAQYHMPQFHDRNVRYFSISIGMGRLRFK
jgi:hypothetical protein